MSKVSSAKTRGRLTKKELKQDKLVQYAYQIEAFYRQHQQWVIGAAIVVVAIVVGITLFRRINESSRLERSYQLTMAKMSYGSGRMDEAREGFQKVVNTSGGASAAEAKYFLGRVAFEQGDYPQAETQFSEYLKDFAGNEALDVAAISGLAATLEIQSKPDEAIEQYLKIVQKYPENAFSPQALMEASRLYLKTNQKDKAIDVLKNIQDKYAKSSVASQAKQKLASFE
ncbi:MAG: tetratricopeptide repeat protein [Calditrichota bacterium]